MSFAVALLAPAAALVWLGLRFIEQDRALGDRQVRERRESAADRAIAGLEQALASTERRLVRDPADVGVRPDDDAVVLTWTPAGLDIQPVRRLSGALLRLARTLRKSGAHDQALQVYADLALLPGVRLAGLPADLLARRARCVVFHELQRKADLERAAGSLRADLAAARWPIDRGTFLAYSAEIDRWIGGAPVDAEREAMSEAAEWIVRQRSASADGAFREPGRRIRRFATTSITYLWHFRSSGPIVRGRSACSTFPMAAFKF